MLKAPRRVLCIWGMSVSVIHQLVWDGSERQSLLCLLATGLTRIQICITFRRTLSGITLILHAHTTYGVTGFPGIPAVRTIAWRRTARYSNDWRIDHCWDLKPSPFLHSSNNKRTFTFLAFILCIRTLTFSSVTGIKYPWYVWKFVSSEPIKFESSSFRVACRLLYPYTIRTMEHTQIVTSRIPMPEKAITDFLWFEASVDICFPPMLGFWCFMTTAQWLP